MRYPKNSSARRPGVVLLVVMALLALFASVALSFVFYADNEAIAANLYGQSLVRQQPDIDPEVLQAYFLSQLVYDTNNPYSAMRGWSMSRSMYGNNPNQFNAAPYVGVGRSALSYPDPDFIQPPPAGQPTSPSVDAFAEINYQLFTKDPTLLSAVDLKAYNFLRSPEYFSKTPATIISATNANPIVITTGIPNQSPAAQTPHNLTTGQQVTINGVQGNTAANGTFTITVLTANTFALLGTTGNGVYTSGGTWFPVGFPNLPYSSPIAGITTANAAAGTGLITVTTLANPHNLQTGQVVSITGVQGTTSANGSFIITVPAGSPNTFTLNGSNGNGVYTGGGTWMAGFFGQYRYVGGADPPWTAYDTNSLFLAQVRADGTVLMPSFSRPWNANILANLRPAEQANVAKYLSLRPDSPTYPPLPAVPTNLRWNPLFLTPDSDAGGDVQNLEGGPNAQNDSNWMDLGFPIMTAPNGKRYKPLFAPLIMDLSNRLHLWAQGNMRGTAGNWHTSGMGMSPTDVNLNALPMPTVAVTQAHDLGGAANNIQITTASAHNFSVGQNVLINGVTNVNYNGVRAITQVPTATTFRFTIAPNPGLPVSKGGTVAPFELANLYNLRYAGANGPGGTGLNIPNVKPGPFFSMITSDGLDASTKLSALPPMGGFQTLIIPPIPKAGARTVQVQNISNLVPAQVATPNGLPWTIEVGMQLTVGTGATAEVVTVTAVNRAVNPPTIRAVFTQAHAAGTVVAFNPYFGYPTFPFPGSAGAWQNGSPTELTNNPLAFNLTTNPPLPMSNQEALLRFNGTNAPALTSEIFRRMPFTFANPRNRNMVTLVNNHLDRITGSPYLNFDRTAAPAQYAYNPVKTYPLALAGNTAPDYSNFQGANTSLAPPWKTEFGTDWRSTLGNYLRIDLNRALPDYPAAAPVTGSNVGSVIPLASYTAYGAALSARQQLAKDIYQAMVRVTGARDPNVQNLIPPMTPGSADYEAARWLAQLAVNMVDYIDNDDYSTPFNWNVNAVAGSSDGWVFGVELPRLVLSEIYAQHDVTNPTTQRLNLWAELHNPFTSSAAGAYPTDTGIALLEQLNPTTAWNAGTSYVVGQQVTRTGSQYICIAPANGGGQGPPNTSFWALVRPIATPFGAISANAVYKVLACPKSVQLDAAMSNPANNLGDPDFGNAGPNSLVIMDNTKSAGTPVANPWGGGNLLATHQVLPASGSIGTGTPVSVAIAPVAATAANSGASEAGTVVTIKTAANHPFVVGQTVTISGVTTATSPAELRYNGTFVITAVPNNRHFRFNVPTPTLPYQLAGGGTAVGVANSNAGYYVVAPQGSWYPSLTRNPDLPASFASPGLSVAATASADIAPVATPGASEVGNTVTITTVSAHALTVGQRVTIRGVGAGYDGTYTVISVPTPTSFTYTSATAGLAAAGGGTMSANLTVLLQRLANPHMPFNNVVTSPLYNPYITVDYFDNVPVTPSSGVPTSFASFGRKQPYAAHTTQVVNQVGTALPNQPQNTFFRANTNPTNTPYNWLVHLDRPPVNPIEMLHVSGCRPFEVTQRFINATGAFQHYAQWNPFAVNQADAQSTLLHRTLDLMSARYMAGLNVGGRIPGVINLNTMTEPEIFAALCDAHDTTAAQFPYPWFTQADVLAVFNKILIARSNGSGMATAPTGEGRPFKSFSDVNWTNASVSKLDDTWFRNDPTTGQPIFLPPSQTATSAHPYAKSALLQKIYNNISTTSNVFGVWWTVGYFEVVDESVRPARLGAEIGRDDNRHIRHRFFAIVDRSGLQLFNTASTVAATANNPAWNAATSYTPGTVVNFNGAGYRCTAANSGLPPLPATVASRNAWVPIMSVLALTGSANNVPLAIQPGMLLEVDTGLNAETVRVRDVFFNSFTAVFTKDHASGAPIVCRGNPGPRTNYNPKQDSNVVLHVGMIQ